MVIDQPTNKPTMSKPEGPPDFKYVYKLKSGAMLFNRVVPLRGFAVESTEIDDNGDLVVIVLSNPGAKTKSNIETLAVSQSTASQDVSVASTTSSLKEGRSETTAMPNPYKKRKHEDLEEDSVFTVSTTASVSLTTSSQTSILSEVAFVPPATTLVFPFETNSQYKPIASWANKKMCITHPPGQICVDGNLKTSDCHIQKCRIMGHKPGATWCFKCGGLWMFCQPVNKALGRCFVDIKLRQTLRDSGTAPEDEFCYKCLQFFSNTKPFGLHPGANTQCRADFSRILWHYACRTDAGYAKFSSALTQWGESPPPQVPLMTDTNKKTVLDELQIFANWLSASPLNNRKFWAAVHEAWKP
jgi:hypothetical protein